ncbi:TonB-dependent receptor [Sphingomonas sp. NCPPB 2930]
MAPLSLWAQETPLAEPAASGEAKELETMVITGTASGRSKLNAPFAISTVNERQIDRAGASSTADLLKRVPGFAVESSGGQGGGQNIYARGLPSGGWFFVQLQQNGLTLWDEPQESFLNIDTLHRVDAMTERVEVVRGGTSPIFATNAPGGTVNFITRRGTEAPEGSLRVTTGSHGLQRYEGYVSGPITDRLSYAVGGFLRQDKGLREPGFTADKGGQITAVASLRLDDGRLDIEAKYLNDRTAFYTGIPLQDPRDPSRSLAGLIDPGTGTLGSNDFRRVDLRSFQGTSPTRISRDLADGIHTDLKQINTTFEHGLANGWRLTNRLGALDARVGYDAIFSGDAPQDAGTYLAGKLPAARTGFGPSVSRLGYAYANTRGANGQRIAFDPSASGGLVMENQFISVDTALTTISDDLRLNKSIELPIGRQDLSLGLYYNHFSFTQRRQPNVLLTSVQNRPSALDVLAYDAAGNTVGSVTENGFVRYGNGVVKGDATGYYLSPYLANTWQLTEKISVDAGVRHTIFSESGRNYTADFSNQGDTGTLADNNVGGLTGAYTDKKEKLNGNSWTLGTSYRPVANQQLFARYTESVRFPRPQNVYLLQNLPVTKIQQAEAGWRTAGPLSVSAVAFWSHFNRLVFNGMVLNPASGLLENLPLVGQTDTVGLETEINWRASSMFSINGNVTVQNPRTKSLLNLATGASGAAYENKQISRIPRVMASIQPIFNFAVADRPVELSATISRVGERYVDYANTTALPAYTTVDLGLLVSVSPSTDLQLQVNNATNSHGLTEGNPRVDGLSGQGTANAIYGRPIFGRSMKLSLNYRW